MTRQFWMLSALFAATIAIGAQQEAPAPSNPLGQPLVDAAGKVRKDLLPAPPAPTQAAR